MTRQALVEKVLARETPGRIVYAPNYWQWFAHHRNHGCLPPELADCGSQLEMINRLGLDVLSRNIYCDEQRGWWGGLSDVVVDGLDYEEQEHHEGRDLVIERRWGRLTERLRYVFAESTLAQERYAVNAYAAQLDDLERLLRARRWRFIPERFEAIRRQVGDGGVVMAGEVFSPLKMLHVLMGPQDTTYFLMDYPERAADLLPLHEAAQLDLVRQMCGAGVQVVMSMDNLDTAFHPPRYVEQYSASFYEKASRICHEHGSLFFIHACGHQKDNLALIAGLGVDGLEGVAYPPLGNVELDEAMRLSGERLIITGGISPLEAERQKSRDDVRRYVEGLFRRMRPFRHRFVLAGSCNTSIRMSWDMIVWFRDAWREFGG